MINIGIFDNTNYNYILNYLREIYNINIVDDFKIFNAFSIKNITNYYDILLIMTNVTEYNKEKIKHVLKKSKLIILNGDDQNLIEIINKSELNDVYMITYGYNTKSTITISSIDELEQRVICVLQRNINDIYSNYIEPKELSINKGYTKFSNLKLLGIVTLMLVLGYIK